MKKRIDYPVNHRLETSGSYVDSIMGKLTHHESYQIYKIRQCWPQVVGKDLAACSYLRTIQNGIAHVTVLNSVYKNYMFMYRAKLAEQMNALLGEERIRDIRFSAGRKREERPYSDGPEAKGRTDGLLPLETVDIPQDRLAAIEEQLKEAAPPLKEKLRTLRRQRERQSRYLRGQGYHVCPTCGRWLEKGREFCFFCAMKERQEQKTRLVRLLEMAPWLEWEEAKAMADAPPLLFQEAKREMIYSILDKIFRGIDTEEDDMRFAFLVTRKKPAEMTDAFIRNLANKYRKKYGAAADKNGEKKST